MSEPKKQHIVPKCYLKHFVDPNTPKNHEPYVWVFDKKGKKGKKRSPKNTFTQTDIYTLKVLEEGKDYSIEKNLSQIEGEYSSVFENKIKKHLPLSTEEHVILCAFVAAMLQRTLKQKRHIEGMLDQMIKRVEVMEKARNLPPKKSLELKKEKENAHAMSLASSLPSVTATLVKMNVAFLCSKSKNSFITSDNPCYLFNSQMQWQRIYSPDLNQRNVEVRMPLSPEITVDFSWVNNLRGYLAFEPDMIHELNRATYNNADGHFIARSPKLKRRWFRRHPIDPVFLFKMFRSYLRHRRIKKYHERRN